jgi:NitT/TauT family transport system substrate-binding protein
MTPVSIGLAFHSPFYAPLFAAVRLGAFVEEGLDPAIVVPAPGGTVGLLEGGQADVILSGVMRTLVLADSGGPRHPAIAEVNSRDGFVLVSREPAPRFAWRDLEGRRLALFGLAPTPWMCLRAALREQGVDPSRVHVLAGLDVAQGIAALRSGEADYLQTGQPTAEELVAEGLAHPAAPQAPIVGHVPYSSLIVTEATRRERPDLCAAAVRALTRALRWIAGHDAGALADLIAPDFPATRPPILWRAVARLREGSTWSGGPRQERAPFERLARMLAEGGLIREIAPWEALVDDRFARAAVAAPAA